jgi:hypothetical protein
MENAVMTNDNDAKKARGSECLKDYRTSKRVT